MPNVYVHVTLLQPHAQVLNDLPIRLYGMVPITVQDPQTILKPIITTAAVIRPDENSNISVSEANGKAMTYTLAVVDEGLLDLTRFKTPDPYSKFYAREALGVKSFDLYDYVMGSFGMQMNRILSIGGDEGIDRKSDKNKANRFKPVVKFIGPFHLKAGETAKHQIKIENYIGSVRVMVVAGYDGAYGFAEKAVPVKSPPLNIPLLQVAKLRLLYVLKTPPLNIPFNQFILPLLFKKLGDNNFRLVCAISSAFSTVVKFITPL
jgi:uncharacterized protein YfaS (alpha-2-macroglobulin family)